MKGVPFMFLQACTLVCRPWCLLKMTGTQNTTQLRLPNVPEAFMDSADVLLVLDECVTIPCHSHILAMHSAVLCNMLADLDSSQPDEEIKIPLADFTAEQCLAVLDYLYATGASYKGPAFANHEEADLRAALAVARFAHAYDAPQALRHVEAYLADTVDAQYNTKTSDEMPEREGGELFDCQGFLNDETVLDWALMAEHFGMHDLHDQCERAMVMHWECFQDRPDLVDELSWPALQRIAKGLNMALLATARSTCNIRYPDVRDFAAWREGKQQETRPTVRQSATTSPASTACASSVDAHHW